MATEELLSSLLAAMDPTHIERKVKDAKGLEVKKISDNEERRLVFTASDEDGEHYRFDFLRRSPTEIDIYITNPDGMGQVLVHDGKSDEAAWQEYDFLLEPIDASLEIFGANEVEVRGQDIEEEGFSDREIEGIISTLSDEGVIGEPFIQIDASGVSTRSEDNIPQWAIREAESKSAPFTVNGETYVAFGGRGYTAIVNQ